MSPETRAAVDAATETCRAETAAFRDRDRLMPQVFALSDERDQWLKFALDWTRDVYRYAYADGRADEARDADQAWAAVPVPRHRDEPDLAELELLRWGSGGRECFGDPRPGDYAGGTR